MTLVSVSPVLSIKGLIVKNILKVFWVLLFTVTTLVVVAQEQTQELNETETQSEQTDNKQNQPSAQEDKQQSDQQPATPPVAGNGDTFVPSEEISEDLSVSFPVDI